MAARGRASLPFTMPSKPDVAEELAQLRAEVRALQQRVDLRRRWGALGVLVALSSTFAFAQLVTFTPNSPALASDVNGNFTQLKTWLEQKVGTAGTASISATGLAMNGNRITGVAQPSADTDVVTKAHLKALFNRMVIWVAGGACPTGFSPYSNAHGRYPLGDVNGSQGQGGVSSIFIYSFQQQAGGSGFAKTGAVGIGNDIGGLVGSTDTNDVQGGWTYRQSQNLDIRPVYIQLKPCIFNAAY